MGNVGVTFLSICQLVQTSELIAVTWLRRILLTAMLNMIAELLEIFNEKNIYIAANKH